MVFVTGGTGFLGLHLLKELVDSGRHIRALKRRQAPVFLEKQVAEKIEWVEGDVLDIPSLENGVRGCSELYHCAAKVSFQSKDRKTIREVNVEGTANVVNVALHYNIRKLVHVSSVAAIATATNNLPVNESIIGEYPSSSYGISKYLAEQEVWRGAAEGLNAVIINPAIIIGGGNWHEGTPQFFLNVWRGMPFYTSGGSGFVAVLDVVKLMVYLMESDIKNERFIISAENWTYKDFLYLIAELLKKKPPYIHLVPWLSEFIWRFEPIRATLFPDSPVISKETARLSHQRQFFDSSKIKNVSGFSFTPIKLSIEGTCSQFMEDLTNGKIK
ncbi:MAG: NAD-dependent epimerase/dehydratase family protein [Chitinophagales bacterium]|nr:NAD-dependent epimerase/dehydratase family protein [Chitinophagales bacterium]